MSDLSTLHLEAGLKEAREKIALLRVMGLSLDGKLNRRELDVIRDMERSVRTDARLRRMALKFARQRQAAEPIRGGSEAPKPEPA